MLLEISTAIDCPMSCSYCPQELIRGRYQGPRLMSVETFTKALANAPADICVSFAGYAEPYLNNQCSRMIGVAVSRFHPVQVYTTGIGMDDDDVDMLIRIQPAMVKLHLPDGDGDMKAKVTDEYVARMKRLRQSVKMFQGVVFGSLHPKLKGFDWNEQGHGLVSRAGNVASLSQFKKPGALVCGPDPKNENNVLVPDGGLYVCCCDYGLHHRLGNLVEQNWYDIHRGDAKKAFTDAMVGGTNAMCQVCEFAQPKEMVDAVHS